MVISDLPYAGLAAHHRILHSVGVPGMTAENPIEVWSFTNEFNVEFSVVRAVSYSESHFRSQGNRSAVCLDCADCADRFFLLCLWADGHSSGDGDGSVGRGPSQCHHNRHQRGIECSPEDSDQLYRT